jgi:hypothetical protein
MPETKAKPAKKPFVLLLFLLLLEKCGNLSFKTKMIILAVILAPVLVFFAIRGVFLSRSPLVFVTDASFNALYGPERLGKMEKRLSNRLFRRVISVYVDENAGQDQVSFAAEDASQKPLAVLLPHRYMGAGDNYKESRPDTPVFIASGRNQSSKAKGAVSFIRTDIKTDYYRAGLCAALLAGEGTITFISDENVPNENRGIFIEGLRAQGYEKEPNWARYNTDFLSENFMACAVIAGPVGDFFEQKPDIPVILFSWADPNYTPRAVKVIFDDSPYTLALVGAKLFSSAGAESEVFISSVPTVLKDRIEEKKVFKKLKGLVKKDYQNK